MFETALAVPIFSEQLKSNLLRLLASSKYLGLTNRGKLGEMVR